MLVATELYKKFGALEVLKGVSISLQKGELATIVGPSGCGKSTLLHILGTLDAPDKGQITMNGTDFSNLKGKQLAAFRNKHIGFVFQFHHLLPEFNALENVSIPAWIAGRKKSEVKEAATELLKKMGLENRLTHKPSELSGGEQQRVAVARALINKPSIVLADEPTGNLDSAHARELHQLFISLKNELGQSFLIVTHNEELAAQSDRVWTMRDGRIV
ncbi:MAG: ABC transporter ATP-binding protein [Chitinophagaceae bacterium]|nr:ABC transporter ATP-binding protein [Chitinophagaceae bacterium]NCW88012.1 ABC transporter ATP-binding protein [Chitinophagia bacterium]